MSDDITKIKTAVANIEEKAKSLISNPRFTSSRLWFAIGGLLAIVLLHRFGIDEKILGYIFQITILFLVLRTLTDVARDGFNTLIECCRIRHGYDDGAPVQPGDTVEAPHHFLAAGQVARP